MLKELEKICLSRLRNILKSKSCFYILLFIVIFVSVIRCFVIKRDSLYNGNEVDFLVTVKSIKKDLKDVIIVNGKEKLISYYENFSFSVGDTVKIKGSLSKINNNTIPNLFNYNRYLQSKGIYYELKISDIKLVSHNNNFLIKIRIDIENRIKKIPHSEYLYAFILGDTSYFSKDIKSKYQFNGLSYLLAMGSLQVMLIINLLKKILLKIRLKKIYQLIIIIIFLALYIFLTNGMIGVLRSSLTYLICEILKYFKVKYRYVNILILVCSFLLLLNPYYIVDIGFQYSFVISFMINEKRKWIKGNLLKKSLIVSIIANIASFPITIYNNFEFNFMSIILSAIFLPIINYFIFPLAIIVFFFPILCNVFDFCISLLESLIHISSLLTFLNIIFRKPIILLIFIFYIYFFKTKKFHIFLIHLFVFLPLYQFFNRIIDDRFITFLDVNEGDACVLKIKNNVYLFDTGGGKINDYSESIVKYLHSYGVNKINKLFLTHGDMDHLGSSYKLIEKIKVDNVYFNSNDYNENELELIKILNKKKINYQKISEYSFSYDKISFNIQSYNLKEENDSSMILSIIDNKTKLKILIMGDASSKAERLYMKYNNLADYTILKVGHHGSKTSSSKYFIDEINPRYSVISVGKNNWYGHPNKEVLDNLKNSRIYRTDENGSIMFKIKKNKLRIETYSP